MKAIEAAREATEFPAGGVRWSHRVSSSVMLLWTHQICGKTCFRRTWIVVSEDNFAVLGVSPLIGRSFQADDFITPGPTSPVIITHGLWQRRYSTTWPARTPPM
jgi:hypothetical protein